MTFSAFTWNVNRKKVFLGEINLIWIDPSNEPRLHSNVIRQIGSSHWIILLIQRNKEIAKVSQSFFGVCSFPKSDTNGKRSSMVKFYFTYFSSWPSFSIRLGTTEKHPNYSIHFRLMIQLPLNCSSRIPTKSTSVPGAPRAGCQAVLPLRPWL